MPQTWAAGALLPGVTPPAPLSRHRQSCCADASDALSRGCRGLRGGHWPQARLRQGLEPPRVRGPRCGDALPWRPATVPCRLTFSAPAPCSVVRRALGELAKAEAAFAKVSSRGGCQARGTGSRCARPLASHLALPFSSALPRFRPSSTTRATRTTRRTSMPSAYAT